MKVLPLLLLPLISSVVGCGATCENEVLFQTMSPSGRAMAVAFSRHCGATTAFNVQVSILPVGSSLENGKGNALIADSADLASLAWKGENIVEAKFSKEPRVFKSSPVDGVRVVTSASL